MRGTIFSERVEKLERIQDKTRAEEQGIRESDGQRESGRNKGGRQRDRREKRRNWRKRQGKERKSFFHFRFCKSNSGR